jgi:hypothetical protein
MIPDPDIAHSASQSLMAIGFSASLLAMLWAKRWFYAVFSLLALIETYQRSRFPLHGWVRLKLLGAEEVPGARQALQSNMLYVSGMLGLALCLVMLPTFLRANAAWRMRAIGGVIILAVLALELISLHQVDAIIYHYVGGYYARSSIAYFTGAALIVGSAFITPRKVQHAAHPQQ